MSFFVFLAVRNYDLSAHSGWGITLGSVGAQHHAYAPTEFRDEVSAKEASASKDGDDVAADGAVPWHARRDDRFPARQRDDVVQRTLSPYMAVSKGESSRKRARHLALDDDRALSAQEV